MLRLALPGALLTVLSACGSAAPGTSGPGEFWFAWAAFQPDTGLVSE